MPDKNSMSLDDKLKAVQQGVYDEGAKNDAIKFRTTNTTFSPVQTNMARYLTYGAKTYGQLGFDPLRNNSAKYNANTSAVADIGRALEGTMKLAKVGFTDTFAFGSLAGKSNSLEFEKVMNNYSSDRGGATGLISNTLLSSGYTMGIMAAIAAEEIGMTAVTALTGGLGSVGQAAETTRLLGALDKGMDVSKSVKTIDRIEELSKVTKPSMFRDFARALNPLENTIDFAKDVKTAMKADDPINGLQMAVKGSASLVRDARKIYMSHSESKLEAELAKNEFLKAEMEKAEMFSKTGEVPEDVRQDIENRANQLYNKIYTGNFGLIYMTNALVFDNMFKTMKGTNRYFNEVDNGLFNIKRGADNKVSVTARVNPLTGTQKYLKELQKDLTTWKGLSRSVLSSSMEGFQEVGQDALSESAKAYYTNRKNIDQIKGNFLSQIADDLGVLTSGDFLSEVGSALGNAKLETFLSGALMGAFASPVGLATQGTNSFLFEGGLQNLRDQISNSEEFQKIKNGEYENRKAKAKVLEKFFNEEKNFTQFLNKSALNQAVSESEMIESSRSGDEAGFRNAQERSFAEGLDAVFKYGFQDQFKGHLLDMADNFSTEQLREIFGRPDITEENASKYRGELRERAEKVDYYKQRYDVINQMIPSVPLNGLNKKDPEYLEKVHRYMATESLKRELLFSSGAIKDKAQRLSSIAKDLSAVGTVTNFGISQTYDETALGNEIALLKNVVSANKQLDLDAAGKEKAVQDEERLNVLREYQTQMSQYKQELASGKVSDATKMRLFESFQKLLPLDKEKLSTSAGFINTRNAFSKVLDYMRLEQEKGSHEDFVDAMGDFKSRDQWIARKKDLLDDFERNKGAHIERALKAFDEERISSEMLNELYQGGVFFSLTELDNLLENGIMPETIFDVKNQKVASKEQYDEAVAIIKKHVSRLSGIQIQDGKITSDDFNKRLNSDERTIQDILDEYGLSLGQEIDLSTADGVEFLNALIDSGKTVSSDDQIITTFMERTIPFKISFNNEQNRAVELSKDGVSIDLRFVGSEYNNQKQSGFEQMVVRAITQKIISDQLSSTDGELISEIISEVEDYLKDKVDNLDQMDFMQSPQAFVIELLNNRALQENLSELGSIVDLEGRSTWDTLFEAIEEESDAIFTGNALQKVLSIAKSVISQESVVATTDSVVVDDSETGSTSDQESVDQVEEQPQDQESVEDTAEGTDEEILTDELSKLYAERSDLYKELMLVNEARKSANIFKRKSLNRRAMDLAMKINIISDRIDELSQEQESKIEVAPVGPIVTEIPTFIEERSEDVFGNKLLTPKTAWKELPQQVKAELISKFTSGEESLQTADSALIAELVRELQENPMLQDVLNQYNNEVIAQSEFEYNQRALAIREVNRKNRARTPKKTTRKANTFFTSLDHIARIFKNEKLDLSILTEKEATELLAKLSKTKRDVVPFTTQDILNYIQSKIAKAEKKKLVRQEKRRIKNTRLILRNLKSIDQGVVTTAVEVNGKMKRVKVTVNQDFINVLAQKNPKLFKIQDLAAFEKAYREVLVKAAKEIESVKGTLKSAQDGQQVESLFRDYYALKMLYPDVVKALNKAFLKTKTPLIVRTSRSGGEIKHSLTNTKRSFSPKARKRSSRVTDLQVVNEYLLDEMMVKPEIGNSMTDDAYAAMLLAEKGLSPEYLERLSKNNFVPATRRSFVKKSGLKKFDSSDVFIPEEYVPRMEQAIFNLVTSFSSKSKMLAYVASQIKDAEANLMKGNEQQYTDEDFEQAVDSTTEQNDFADFIDFLETDEGQNYLSSSYIQQIEYQNSVEFQIETGLFKGSLSDLTSDQRRLYEQAFANGIYENSEMSIEEVVHYLNDLNSQLNRLKVSPDYVAQTEEALSLENDLNAEIAIYNELINQMSTVDSVDNENFDDFFPKKSVIGKESEKVFKLMVDSKNKYDVAGKIVKALKSNPEFPMLIALGMAGLNLHAASDDQKVWIANNFQNALSTAISQNPYVVLSGSVFEMVRLENNNLIVRDASGNEIVKNLFDIEREFEKVGNPGDVIQSAQMQSVVNVNQIAYIKKEFMENLNTFERAQLPEYSSIVSDLKEHLKKC